jgi:hypothetical protein
MASYHVDIAVSKLEDYPTVVFAQSIAAKRNLGNGAIKNLSQTTLPEERKHQKSDYENISI